MDKLSRSVKKMKRAVANLASEADLGSPRKPERELRDPHVNGNGQVEDLEISNARRPLSYRDSL